MKQEQCWHRLGDVLCVFVHALDQMQTLMYMWALMQAQEKQQGCVGVAARPSLAEDSVTETHVQAASKSPRYLTLSARNTAELSARLPNAGPASEPSSGRNIQISVNISHGTSSAAVKDINENAQTEHGSRKRAKRSKLLEQVIQTA